MGIYIKCVVIQQWVITKVVYRSNKSIKKYQQQRCVTYNITYYTNSKCLSTVYYFPTKKYNVSDMLFSSDIFVGDAQLTDDDVIEICLKPNKQQQVEMVNTQIIG